MKKIVQEMTAKVLGGEGVCFDEALKMINIDEEDLESLEALFEGANKIREKFVGKKVDLCAIVNGKSGKCSENCKYCAQSAHYNTNVKEYPLLEHEEILPKALEAEAKGVTRFSIVTSGRGISNEELRKLTEIYRKLKKETKLELCASHGIISYEQAQSLKESGVSTYHHNLETSRRYYPNICTTHTYEDRINTIKNAQKAGLHICCGGIIGMGETPEDRVMMFFDIKELGARSVPINILNPIKGTPLENRKVLSPIEILKTIAVSRYILPKAYIRYAGGRTALGEKQIQGFKAGVNAALVGDYLTTVGNKIEEDKQMIRQVGLEV